MALYPEVQNKAQREIDTVIGNNRLPDFTDRNTLPYMNAIVKEAMRISISGLFFLALFGHFLTRSGSKKLKSHKRTSGTNFSTS